MKTLKQITLLLLTISSLFAAPETLTWLAPDPADGVTNNQVWWSTNYSGPFIQILNVANNQCTVQNSGSTWINYYYVVAMSPCCVSLGSDIAFRPGEPIQLKITGNTLTWAASPAADQVTLYQIWSSPTLAGPWALLTTTATNSFSGLTNTRTFLRVYAVNPYGVSDASDVVVRPGKPQGMKVTSP